MTRVLVQELRPGDVLLFPVDGYGWLNPVVRRLITYGHAAIYWTETKRRMPLIVESIGRGVLIRCLYAQGGRTALVLRHPDPQVGVTAAKTAERLSDNPASWYGYLDIPRWVIPKLVLAKLGRWMPKWANALCLLMMHTYRHNPHFICSELVCQAYQGVGVALTSNGTIPLPDDIAASKELTKFGELEIPQWA